jgi:hypothetical protein
MQGVLTLIKKLEIVSSKVQDVVVVN